MSQSEEYLHFRYRRIDYNSKLYSKFIRKASKKGLLKATEETDRNAILVEINRELYSRHKKIDLLQKFFNTFKEEITHDLGLPEENRRKSLVPPYVRRWNAFLGVAIKEFANYKEIIMHQTLKDNVSTVDPKIREKVLEKLKEINPHERCDDHNMKIASILYVVSELYGFDFTVIPKVPNLRHDNLVKWLKKKLPKSKEMYPVHELTNKRTSLTTSNQDESSEFSDTSSDSEESDSKTAETSDSEQSEATGCIPYVRNSNVPSISKESEPQNDFEIEYVSLDDTFDGCNTSIDKNHLTPSKKRAHTIEDEDLPSGVIDKDYTQTCKIEVDVVKNENLSPVAKRAKPDTLGATGIKHFNISMEMQNNKLFTIRGEIQQLTTNEMIELLVYNDQRYSNIPDTLTDILSDRLAFGCVNSCTKCGGKNLFISGYGYVCTGKPPLQKSGCGNIIINPERNEFKIPLSFKTKYEFLKNYVSVVEKRLMHVTEPSNIHVFTID